MGPYIPGVHDRIKHKLQRAVTLYLASVFVMGGCVDNDGEHTDPVVAGERNRSADAAGSVNESTPNSTTPFGPAKVAHRWQQRMAAALLAEQSPSGSGATEAYGLFSEGGWSNAGQTMVLVTPDGVNPISNSSAELRRVSPGRRDVDQERQLRPAEWQRLAKATKAASNLQDLQSTGFDGIIFEYVAMKMNEGVPQVTRRLLIEGNAKDNKPYEAFLAAWYPLME